jgi:tRNA pseudouridine38-40 synthase
MARYKVILAYDGTGYLGFQRQGKSRTVQAVVETALRQIGWQGRTILAAGRTDTGVHAAGQVVAFDLDWKHPLQDLRAALNACLPPDVAVQAVKQVADTFHPRFAALARCYLYHIFCQEQRNPLRERFAWRVWPGVALEPMQQAAADLLGTHDFSAFGTPPKLGGNTTRTVLQAFWRSLPAENANPELVFEITSDAFLYHMVRRLVTVLVSIGQGHLETGAVARLLDQPQPARVQGLAPPNGLVLVEVIYP